MISTTEAKSIIRDTVRAKTAVQMPLQEGAGLTLATDVYATTDIPAFPQSAMDGYAFSFNGWRSNTELIIDGEIAAGGNQAVEIGPGKAVRIFTGAAVPAGADTVVMQERIKLEKGKLIIEDVNLQQGANVRPQGSEIRAGMLALPKGSRLSPAAIGFLAGIGTTEIWVYPHPSVSIIVTGNELQQPGKALEYGQVYESNSATLTAALQLLHVNDVKVQHVPDDPDALTAVLQQALHNSDIVLLTGGISVGDYDFVLQAATRCGVVSLFHKIRQRPGKPLYFGKWHEKLVFGLPGNPSSVLTCFYMYVIPALEQLSQHSFGLHSIQAPLSKLYRKNAGLTHYLKGHYDGQTATPLDAQESYRMRSFAGANCLIQVDEHLTDCREGALVEVHLLPV